MLSKRTRPGEKPQCTAISFARPNGRTHVLLRRGARCSPSILTHAKNFSSANRDAVRPRRHIQHPPGTTAPATNDLLLSLFPTTIADRPFLGKPPTEACLYTLRGNCSMLSVARPVPVDAFVQDHDKRPMSAYRTTWVWSTIPADPYHRWRRQSPRTTKTRTRQKGISQRFAISRE